MAEGMTAYEAAYKLVEIIRDVEGMSLCRQPETSDRTAVSREWLLSTYRDCIAAVLSGEREPVKVTWED